MEKDLISKIQEFNINYSFGWSTCTFKEVRHFLVFSVFF